jgi:hypothetical protein
MYPATAVPGLTFDHALPQLGPLAAEPYHPLLHLSFPPLNPILREGQELFPGCLERHSIRRKQRKVYL